MIDVKRVVDEVEHKVVLIIGDTRYILEHILQSLLEEPLVGRFLHLNEVGHIDYFFDFAKAHSLGVAKLYGFDIYHRRITP